MKSKTYNGQVIPINRDNVDTDLIIPKQYLKSIEKLLTKISTPHLIIILGQVSHQLLTLGREDEPVYLLSMLE